MIDFVKARRDFLELTENWDNEKWSKFDDNPLFQGTPLLSHSHLKNCRLIESREKMLEYLPKNAVIAEVGTQNGYFAEKLLAVTNPKKLHIIDINLSSFQNAQKQNELLQKKLKNGTIQLHEGDSSQILMNFPNDYFDWIYIDADHSYEGVIKDIYQGHSKLKKDGLLVFNDYTCWSVMEFIPYGVARAVNEFCIANDWELVFLAFNCIGYHDVAIKKKNKEQLQIPISEEEQPQSELQQAFAELKRAQIQVQQLQKNLKQAKNQIDVLRTAQITEPEQTRLNPETLIPRRFYQFIKNKTRSLKPLTSMFFKNKMRLPLSTEPSESAVQFPNWVAFEPSLVPPFPLMRIEGVDTLEEWFRWAEEWSMLLRIYGGITKTSNVLEIGCGLGRIAFPLRYILTSQGSYEGFEICQEKVTFLEQTFHQIHPNFRFIWANLQNTFYNPLGQIKAQDYRFPYQDNHFDLAFAASVFTHMQPKVAAHYFQETARVLKPKGKAVFSFFLLDYYRPGQLRPGGFARSSFNFDYSYDSYGDEFAIVEPSNPEFMTAYRLNLIQRFAEQAGLEFAQEPIAGLWSGTTENWVGAQDLIILQKRS